VKILGIRAENVKRLQLVELKLDPDGHVVIIRGANGQGKTSLIDAVMYALGGKEVHPEKVIRRGADKASVVLDLGELVVERRWTSDEESHLVVRSAAGGKYPSPQTMLDKLFDSLSFDPLAFMRMPKKEREEVLRAQVGLDFGGIDAKRKEHFEDRTAVNRDIKALESRLAVLPEAPAALPEIGSLEDLLAEQEMLQAAQKDNDQVRRDHQVALDKAARAAAVRREAAEIVAEAERRLAQAKEQLERRDAELQAANAEVDAIGATVRQLVDPDLSGVRDRIRMVQSFTAQAAKFAERNVLQKQLAEKSAASEALTQAIANLDAEKERLLAETKFPVVGLSFNLNGSVTFKGLPLEQASGAEQLRLSVAIGIALNPRLRVLLLRDASLLDAASLQLVHDMAAEADMQVLMEVVGAEGPGIVIEDGRVAAIN
jgi:energy-coupling factor transporter ATP-binding protein EcfA2